MLGAGDVHLEILRRCFREVGKAGAVGIGLIAA